MTVRCTVHPRQARAETSTSSFVTSSAMLRIDAADLQHELLHDSTISVWPAPPLTTSPTCHNVTCPRLRVSESVSVDSRLSKSKIRATALGASSRGLAVPRLHACANMRQPTPPIIDVRQLISDPKGNHGVVSHCLSSASPTAVCWRRGCGRAFTAAAHLPARSPLIACAWGEGDSLPLGRALTFGPRWNSRWPHPARLNYIADSAPTH